MVTVLGENEYNYKEEIWTVWNRLPDTYTNLKDLPMALLKIFSSIYFCDTLFSALNNIRMNKQNRLTDEGSGTCLALKCV